MTEPLLTIDDLQVSFASGEGDIQAVRGVSLSLFPHEVLGVVGESGSGKSVTALAVMGLLAKNAQITGSVHLEGHELLGLKERALAEFRGQSIAMIFQDPLTSLNPVYNVGWQIEEALNAHRDLSKEELHAETIRLLEMVGIPHAESRVNDYPHEFSGGMRQRVVIAIAMANNPGVILADEPTTALDVTVQAQVLDALKHVLENSGASLVLITHDLGVIAGLATRVAVMYAGRVVEIGSADDIFYRPAMPYTHGLLGSVPRVDDDGGGRLRQIPGAPPSMVGTKPGCPFAPRCPMRVEICTQVEPELRLVSLRGAAPPEHLAACHRADEAMAMPIGSMFSDSSADFEEPPTP
ncbi:MAG TPA: ABC transporter ATP-binding protein [Acidimicrobiales bacterium]|nr:ABC transporter ATP-binding protein [Acidimicrobiales bacterium]